MMFAWERDGTRLAPLGAGKPLADALWIDLYRPQPEQVAQVTALGIEVPTLEDMEEIEISNRLYREGEVDYLTVVLPGQSAAKEQITGPVTFILSATRLVTVRHHAPRPFETYPTRADKVGLGCGDADRLFLSLIEEIIGRLADLLEGTGKSLDATTRRVYGEDMREAQFRDVLKGLGQDNEAIGRVRLALLTIERAISYFGQTVPQRLRSEGLLPSVKGLMRDITALEVHADYLAGRVAMTTDATLGMINLGQAQTTKIVSVVAVVFLPPTMVATVYGMNFDVMPELSWAFGYPMALGVMLASAVGAWAYFKWRNWL
jgi:magnesium transporter